jgi:hypothetical protein
MATIGSLVSERRDTIDPQERPHEKFNYLGLENIQPTTGSLVHFAPKLGAEVRSRSKTFYRNDILYGRLRPYLNKVYVADDPVPEGICSGEFYVLTPRTEIVLPHFLRSLLASRFVHLYVSRWQTGSALPRLQLQDLFSISVPLPPLHIQRNYELFLKGQAEYHRALSKQLAELPESILAKLTEALGAGAEEIEQ